MRIIIVVDMTEHCTVDTVLPPVLLLLVLMIIMGGGYCPIFQVRLLRLKKYEGIAFDHLVNSDRTIT